MRTHVPGVHRRQAWWLSLLLLCLSGAAAVRAESDDHGGASQGVQVETLVQGATSWNGAPLPVYPRGQPQVSVLRITIPAGVTLPRHHHPVINAGMLLQGRLEVISADNERLELNAGDALIEMVNTVHYGKSLGPEPAVIVVVYAGAVGLPTTVRESATSSGL